MLAVDEDSPALFRFGFRGAERGLPILEKMARMQQERERLEEEQRQRMEEHRDGNVRETPSVNDSFAENWSHASDHKFQGYLDCFDDDDDDDDDEIIDDIVAEVIDDSFQHEQRHEIDDCEQDQSFGEIYSRDHKNTDRGRCAENVDESRNTESFDASSQLRVQQQQPLCVRAAPSISWLPMTPNHANIYLETEDW